MREPGLLESAVAWIIVFGIWIAATTVGLLLLHEDMSLWSAIDTAIAYTGLGFIGLMTVMVFAGVMDK